MKTLKLYFESLLDDDDVYLSKTDDVIIKKYIQDNYTITGNLIISKDRVVDCGGGVTVDNWFMTSLTNGLFRWGKIKSYFDCNGCNITSLEGSPKEVGGYFDCSYCNNLKTLEGAPEEVGGYFGCSNCVKLKTLKGAPKKVGGFFSCSSCGKLKSLEGAPEKICERLNCRYCDNLKITDSDRKKYKLIN